MNEYATQLLAEVRACSLCEKLPLGPRPILQFSAAAKILIAGQAPGRITHQKRVPFDDASGDRLRQWLGVTPEQFYKVENFAILPMAFCFPGSGKSGDLPPPDICAQQWRQTLLSQLNNIELTIILGRYAIDWHCPQLKGRSVTQAVQAWETMFPGEIVLPHPSPRNNRWLKNNQWFSELVLPKLKSRVASLIWPG